jgi:hypothetical protein
LAFLSRVPERRHARPPVRSSAPPPTFTQCDR